MDKSELKTARERAKQWANDLVETKMPNSEKGTKDTLIDTLTLGFKVGFDHASELLESKEAKAFYTQLLEDNYAMEPAGWALWLEERE